MKATFSFRRLLYEANLFGRGSGFLWRINSNDWILGFFSWSLLTDVKVLLLLLHSKKREVAELLCLTFPLWDITCSPQTQDINWTFMDVQFTSCVYGIEYDGKGYSLVKTIELLRRSALRLLQSSMLCRIVFIRLLIKIFHGI